ncbi:pyridoxamine 5'-phosphate oxidase family protein [Epibacterium ulvae]|uniref:pyridoxamine 5'-phosphate oxidase family protein n=1 Tax=Epibacterium ulvae TaxID=1156985 RepID=UPI0024903C55|nr:pyridoxamine 5'-phosphate oxidase family protein [Epibacterium ulvae]
MELSGWDKDASPYHPGEVELHTRLGRAERQERMGRFIHRPYMPEQHREFFAQLPFFIAGSVDHTGQPWASILFGQPGFVSSPDPKTLSVKGFAMTGDPYIDNVQTEASVSYLGLEMPTRRRNRLNGVVRSHEGGDTLVDVVQSFGNCPQYIHTRDMVFSRDPSLPFEGPCEKFSAIGDDIRALIERSATFFVASNNPKDDKRINGGVDVNHRGGNPGFVKVDGDTLTVPDFIGNFAFNTLGNFLVNPKAGLLFVDFETGDLVQLTGTVELLWDMTDEVAAFQGAERAWRFTLTHGQRLVGASPLNFAEGEASPNARLTGNWTQAGERQAAEAARTEWRDFRIARIQDESCVIRSFYLEPVDRKACLPSKPGQYLPIKVRPKGADRTMMRTYTLSSAPSDAQYRISVKREDARDDLPAGVVSSHLHSSMKEGDILHARSPQGSFVLDTAETRPAVLIGAGVGITPMISMARQAVSDGFSRRHMRQMTVIHAARTTSERAFAYEFTQLQEKTQGGLRYVSLIEQPTSEEAVGTHFHAHGRISAELLQSLLPLADYEFYLCGPPAFMQATYDLLIDLGVRDLRIHSESFGPASLQRAEEEVIDSPSVQEPQVAMVSFTSLADPKRWRPSDGTLLDFAEAHGITANSSCRRGSCGSCAVRLKSGEVLYRTDPEFEPEQGDVLICCAVPADEDHPIELDL